MRRIILLDPHHIHPFNECARELRIQNKPLWLLQRDLLAPYVTEETEYPNWSFADRLENGKKAELLVHASHLYFNQEFIEAFIIHARRGQKPVRLAFSIHDKAITEHVLPLSTRSLRREGDIFLADMWYLPQGVSQRWEAEPLVIDTLARERGYYHIPPYMATEKGDLVYNLPRRAFVPIESWVHIFIADILVGIFTYGVNEEDKINTSWQYKLSILLHSVMEQKPFLSCSQLVKIGKNCTIHPTAKITGPAIIGDNVQIDAGVVIDACIIGNNVNISQGCQLHISVIGDNCFLPFRAALFMTTLMEHSMVAQNTCLQLCVVGRNSFVGAGSTFTDFNLFSAPLKAMNGRGELSDPNLRVLGGCVGHNCRLGAGLVVHPGRTIESDTILIPDESHFFLKKSVRYEDSHHHLYPDKVTFYPEYRIPPDDYGQEMDRGAMADGEQVTAFDVV
jgi:UDP-N-acetylglucosamine diphosphorylase / glucose-1-phosphate thymidylyltransferase / UDP-N-acetylgalactosamine diphosphorylase / glucosamine-1-phosphate N-acetyltransferase / galactosamine-1-phosphate N-acetyltransferase